MDVQDQVPILMLIVVCAHAALDFLSFFPTSPRSLSDSFVLNISPQEKN
jgi:hypothetical protein